MPRRTDRKQLNAVLSEAQHAALLTLAGSEVVNDYIRRLIAEDAARRGIVWPADLPGPGKYDRMKIGIKPGQFVRVAPHTIRRDLWAGATHTPDKESTAHGYKRAQVVAIYNHNHQGENDPAFVEVEIAVSGGMADYVPLSACELIDETPAAPA